MIIEDLQFLNEIPENSGYFNGGTTSVTVGSFAVAIGDRTWTIADSISMSVGLPYGGVLAVGYSYSVGVAYTAPSWPSFSRRW